MRVPFNPNKSLALVIGAGARFEAEKLMEQTINDARTVSKQLTRLCKVPEDKIITLCGPEASSHAIEAELDRIASVTLPDPLEIFFFYFSGHGAVSKHGYCLVCNDNNGKELDNGLMLSDKLMKKLQAVNTLKMLVLLDCCHAEGMTATAETPFDNEALVIPKPNRLVLSASHFEQVSFLSRPVSVFTYALLEGLSGKYLLGSDRYITVFDLALFVRERVAALSKQKQKPQLNVLQNNITSNFALAHYPEGMQRKPIFDSAFSLVTIDGKSIDTGEPAERDVEFAEGLDWIKNNAITGDGEDLIIKIKGSIRSLNFNLLNAENLVSKMDEAEELRKDILRESDPNRKKQKSLRLGRISKEINSSKEYILSLATTFSRIELNTERLRNAYEEFLKGNADVVDKILDLESLEGEQREILRSAGEIDEQKKLSDKRRILNSNEFLLKASNTLLLDGETDKYRTAETLFLKSIETYRNTVNLFAYGSFLISQNRFHEAAGIFGECISSYSNAPGDRKKFRGDVASAYQNMAYCLEQLNQFVPAEECYLNSLSIYEDMKREGEDVEKELSAAYNNIANLKMSGPDFQESEQYLLKSLQIKKKLSESGSPENMLSLAFGFLGLGKYLAEKGDYENSYNINGSALTILDALRSEFPGKYDAEYARTVNNIAQMLSNMDQIEVAREAFEDCLALRRSLFRNNPAGFSADLSSTLNGYGLMEYKQRNFSKAEILLKEALDLRRELASDFPDSFEDEFAESLENYGMLVLNTKGASSAEPFISESIQIIEKLKARMPRIFLLRDARLKYHRALVHYVAGEVYEAVALSDEALGIADSHKSSGSARHLAESIRKFLFEIGRNEERESEKL